MEGDDVVTDFSNPKKLGFLRFIQVLYAFNIASTLVLTMFIVKDQGGNYNLSFEQLLDFVNLLFDAVAFWLIFRRKKVARYFVPGFCILNIAIGTTYSIATGGFDLFGQILMSVNDIITLVYFLTSRRVRAVLVQPFGEEDKDETVEEDKKIWNLKSFAFWRNIIIYFCIFSVVGHWMEAGLCTLIKIGVVPGTYDPNSQIWRDWLYPFMVYGAGFCACALLLFPVKNWLEKKLPTVVLPMIASFAFNTLVCALLELALGLAQNGNHQLWDYSTFAFNFMGQICLLYSAAFGFVATIMTWFVYPVCERLLGMLPGEGVKVVFIVVVVGFAILISLYYINYEAIYDEDNDSVTIRQAMVLEVDQASSYSPPGQILSV